MQCSLSQPCEVGQILRCFSDMTAVADRSQPQTFDDLEATKNAGFDVDEWAGRC
jgi:hypothetical protein